MRTLIDIGSMNGEEIMWGINHGFEVHAFEPNPNKKFILEPAEKEATINYAAAWNEDGTAWLHMMATPEPGEDGVSLIKEKTNVGEVACEVKTINLGRYLHDLDKDIDILKINAEGAEYVILESVLDHFDYKRIKNWLVEDHSNYIESKDWEDKRKTVLERLENLGVKLEHYKFIESLNTCLN